jgi:hypothetical protein
VTMRDPDDLGEPRFDAAWRAASREEPPRGLDDAIRAAARREVGAGPQRKERVPESLRPERWWWPLAAAATIGAVAIGLLQLANPDKVGAPAGDRTIATDMPAAPAKKQPGEAARADVPAPAREEDANPTITPPLPGSSGGAPRVVVSRGASPVAPQPPVASKLHKDATPRLAQEQQATTTAPMLVQAPASAPVSSSSPTSEPAELQKSRQQGVAAPPPAEPFPADALKREAKEAGAARPHIPAKSPGAAGPNFAAGRLAASAAPPASDEPASDAQRSATSAVERAAPAARITARRAPEPEIPLAAGTASAGADAAADANPEARAKVAPKLSVPDWIALIRKLRDEGKLDEAAKELTLFRTTHLDHERLLPPDLRDWHPERK